MSDLEWVHNINPQHPLAPQRLNELRRGPTFSPFVICDTFGGVQRDKKVVVIKIVGLKKKREYRIVLLAPLCYRDINS